MRILLLNPNTTSEVTDLLYAAGSRAASAGTELVAMTAQRGVPYIATRAEAQIGGAIALEMLAEAGDGFDAAIIAAFGDPGLFGARELFAFPIVGLAEAAMLTACMVGRRFCHRDFFAHARAVVSGVRGDAWPRCALCRYPRARRDVSIDLRCPIRKGGGAGAARESGGRAGWRRCRDFIRRALVRSCRQGSPTAFRFRSSIRSRRPCGRRRRLPCSSHARRSPGPSGAPIRSRPWSCRSRSPR